VLSCSQQGAEPSYVTGTGSKRHHTIGFIFFIEVGHDKFFSLCQLFTLWVGPRSGLGWPLIGSCGRMWVINCSLLHFQPDIFSDVYGEHGASK
jgi:hypothetical protein